MPQHRFAQVDVFSSTPFLGNPVAVVLDADGIGDDDMQRIARWTNLSETTFVLPPTRDGADYRLRIFTPGGELPFAGHPTLGSAAAWLHAGGEPAGDDVVQECGAGLVRIRRSGGILSFEAPPTVRSGAIDEDEVDAIAAAFGIERAAIVDHQWIDNGPGWCIVRLDSADEVLALEPDLSRIPDAMVGAIGAYPEGSPHAFELRAFAPGVGVPEDPVCGSMNASAAQWMTGAGVASAPYTVSQGARLQRAGEIAISTDAAGAVWVGGACTVAIEGTIGV
ncbi:PhzF family phenazine biosynthesis protein [Agrococcus jejuensis]|uniref:Phenazine biosynthesis protein PhzF family n=1 Tax=Agrococcus jejuensis TaxID=399736 RepID=A0A1G8DUI9_9MICO|nr:PhzF family phenazine biosynthesis protein [Agrococcus jejuensis]SDH61343.1 phenazine biosynthesis protein PhzF family [Agrococcus jejuensis]